MAQLTSHERHRTLTRGKGRELRDFLNQFITDSDRVPRRSEMLEQLEELLPDRTGLDMSDVRSALAESAGRIAKAAQDRRGRFELRGRVDELVLKTVAGLDQLDRVAPLPEPEEPVDAGAIADGVEHAGMTSPDIEWEQERREAAELRRKLGVR